MINGFLVLCMLGALTSIALALQAVWLLRPRYRRRGQVPDPGNSWLINRGITAAPVPDVLIERVGRPKLPAGR
jgi:hypothetical protein